jgi:hypothetical protein
VFRRSRRQRIDALWRKEKTAKLAAMLHGGTRQDRERAAMSLLLVINVLAASPYRAAAELKPRALTGTLVRALGSVDSEASFRQMVATTLGLIGDPAAVPALAALLPDRATLSSSVVCRARTVGAAAADALGRIGAAAARDVLVDALTDERFPAARHPLLAALMAQCGPDLARAVIAVLAGAASPGESNLDDQTPGAAVDILGRIGAPRVMEALVEALVDEQEGSLMLAALVAVDAPGVVKVLIRLVQAADPTTRHAAADTLAKLDRLDDEQNGGKATAALRDEVDPQGVLRTFVEEEIRLTAARAREFAGRPDGRLRMWPQPFWDYGEHPEITAAISRGDWAQVVEFGAAAADPLIRMILIGNGPHTAWRGFRHPDIEHAVAALERIVSTHGDAVVPGALAAGVLVDDFAVGNPAALLTDTGAPQGSRRVDASTLRRVCLETYFRRR